jgi:hypothetical protein
MKRIHLANILLICVLGTLLFWPKFEKQVVHESVSTAYDSICMITTGNHIASGVLLESGYVMTAAHVVDHNSNGKIDPSEETFTLKFPDLKEYQAKALFLGDQKAKQDLAILLPTKGIPLLGVKIMSDEEYEGLQVGTPVYTIGMQNGSFPPNITDGRIIEKPYGSNAHRNSANTYFGNSGGGVFIDNKLVGIATAVGMGRMRLTLPMFGPDGSMAFANVGYTVPLANSSLHVPATSAREFITTNNLEDALWEQPAKCPYEAWFAVAGFNVALAFWLLLIFRLMRRWMK